MKMQITVSSAAKAEGDTITPIHRFMLTSQKPANNNTVHTFDIARKVHVPRPQVSTEMEIIEILTLEGVYLKFSDMK